MFIDLCFDFDSRPCALIHTGVTHRPVWEVSDSTPANRNVSGKNHREHHLTSVINEVGRKIGYLLRASGQSAIYANLPSRDGRESPLWFSFLPANQSSNEYWNFRISMQPLPQEPLDQPILTLTRRTRFQGRVLGIDVGGQFVRITPSTEHPTQDSTLQINSEMHFNANAWRT